MVNRFGMEAISDSIEPSGPAVGPDINRTSMSGRWRSPSTEFTVFSCAPPTMSRVMTCVTRIAESVARGALELLESFGDLLGLTSGVGRGVFQIGLVILDRGGNVLAAEGDFPEAVIDLVLGRNEVLQRFVIPLRGVELVALQMSNRAVRQRDSVVWLELQRLVERRHGVFEGFGLN